MGQLNDLPIELIYRIIEIGCLIELREKLRTAFPHPRRRLAFASLVRKVCSSWRDIIDLSTDGRFWLAVLKLTFAMGSTDTSFPRELMMFHRQLAKSRGCSLSVSFEFSVSPRFHISSKVYECDSLDVDLDIALKLFLHGLEMILPYQQQLVQIHVGHSPPQVDERVYGLLCSIRNAPRLTVISLGDVRWYRPTRSSQGFYRPSLRDIRNLGAIVPSFQPILRKNNLESSESILSISHFRNLQSLSISNPGWLSEMVLPPQISRLLVRAPREGSFDLRNLTRQPIICLSLTSLCIWHDNRRSDASQTERIPFIQEDVSLPNLRSIQLWGLPAGVNHYVTHMHHPRIEDVNIIFHDQEGEQPASTARTPQIPSLFTSLTSLALSCDESWIALSVLSRFASPSIRYLNLWFQKEGNHLGSKYDQHFEDCLESIQPETLKIGSKDPKRVIFILERLSRSNLTDLHLHRHPNKVSPAIQTRNENDVIRRSIVSASLVKLTLAGMPLDLIHDILLSTKAHALEELTIDLPWYEESFTFATPTQINHHGPRETSKAEQYALVSKLSLSFSQLPFSVDSALLRRFFDLVPNAERVTLDIGSNWTIEGSTLLEGPSIQKTSFRKYWKPVCEALQPDPDSGLCPLLRLASLIVSFPLESEDLTEPLRMFSHAFRARADAGAPHMEFKVPEERHPIYQDDDETERTLVRLTFGHSADE